MIVRFFLSTSQDHEKYPYIIKYQLYMGILHYSIFWQFRKLRDQYVTYF